MPDVHTSVTSASYTRMSVRENEVAEVEALLGAIADVINTPGDSGLDMALFAFNNASNDFALTVKLAPPNVEGSMADLILASHAAFLNKRVESEKNNSLFVTFLHLNGDQMEALDELLDSMPFRVAVFMREVSAMLEREFDKRNESATAARAGAVLVGCTSLLRLNAAMIAFQSAVVRGTASRTDLMALYVELSACAEVFAQINATADKANDSTSSAGADGGSTTTITTRLDMGHLLSVLGLAATSWSSATIQIIFYAGLKILDILFFDALKRRVIFMAVRTGQLQVGGVRVGEYLYTCVGALAAWRLAYATGYLSTTEWVFPSTVTGRTIMRISSFLPDDLRYNVLVEFGTQQRVYTWQDAFMDELDALVHVPVVAARGALRFVVNNPHVLGIILLAAWYRAVRSFARRGEANQAPPPMLPASVPRPVIGYREEAQRIVGASDSVAPDGALDDALKDAMTQNKEKSLTIATQLDLLVAEPGGAFGNTTFPARRGRGASPARGRRK